MNNDFSLLPRTISDYIYENLKEAILNNELKANQRINEKELAERFQVSRTPVREAVLKLAAQGFVQIDSYKRAVVKEVSYEELNEILQVLAVLDQMALDLALDHLGPKEIRKLEMLTQRMEDYSHPDTAEKYLQADGAFHREIWKAVPNNFLREVLLSVKEKKERYIYASIRSCTNSDKFECGLRLHRELIAAIKARDRKRLKKFSSSRQYILLSALGDREELIAFFRSAGA